MSEKKVHKGIVPWIILFLLGFFVIFLLVLIFDEKRLDTHTEYGLDRHDTLVCKAGPLEGSFFSFDNASQVDHQVKIMFNNGAANTFFYMYSAKFKDSSDAEQKATIAHADYDIYLSKNKLESSRKLDSTFNHIKNEVRIDLYSLLDGINTDTATFFFLNNEKLSDLLKMSTDDFKKYYTNIGFKCSE